MNRYFNLTMAGHRPGHPVFASLDGRLTADHGEKLVLGLEGP